MSKKSNNKSTVKKDQALQPFKGFSEQQGDKAGGIHKSDPEGGKYKKGGDTYLIKRDVSKLQNDIAEFMAAQLFNTIAPGSACEITLHKSMKTNRTFLASKYFKDGYRDLFTELERPRGLSKKYDGKRLEKFEVAQSLLPDSQQYIKRGLAKKDTNGKFHYKNYEQAVVASLALGDKSIHSGNLGVIDKNKLVRIDFGAAFRKFSSNIDPLKSVKNRVHAEKNYFLRDHPKERIYTKEFAKELRREADIDLTASIKDNWKEIVSNYNNDKERGAILAFGKQIGVSKEKLATMSKANKPDFSHIENKLATVMKERQQSLKNMALEIDLKLELSKSAPDLTQVQRLVDSNKKYAELLSKTPKKAQLLFDIPRAGRNTLKRAVSTSKNLDITEQDFTNRRRSSTSLRKGSKTKTSPARVASNSIPRPPKDPRGASPKPPSSPPPFKGPKAPSSPPPLEAVDGPMPPKKDPRGASPKAPKMPPPSEVLKAVEKINEKIGKSSAKRLTKIKQNLKGVAASTNPTTTHRAKPVKGKGGKTR